MKRLTLLLSALILTLAAFGGLAMAAPAAQGEGVPTDDLTALAVYAPEDTALFATIRTDDAYVDILEGLLNGVAANLEIPGSEPLDLREAIGEETGTPYEMLRLLLGDSVAAYIPSFEALLLGGMNDFPAILVADITSQPVAVGVVEDMLADAIEFGDYQVIEREDGSVLFEADFSADGSFLITEDALFFGAFGADLSEIVLPGDDMRNLTQSEAFQNTVNAMPRDDYNFLAYVDPSTTIELVALFAGSALPEVDVEASELADMVGQIAVGGVIVDERSLVLDLTSTGDTPMEYAPFDLALLERVPETTPLLIAGNGLGTLVQQSLDQLAVIDGLIETLEPGAFDELGPIRFESIGTFIRFSFEGTYGIDFDAAMDALDGDFITYVTTGYLTETSELQLGANTLFVTEDVETTTALVEALAEIASEIFNPTTFEDGLLDIPFGALFSMPELATLQIATQDDLVIFGSEQDVAFALEPGESNLTTSDRFAFEEALFLEDTNTLWYVDTQPLRDLLAAFVEDMGDQLSARDRDDLSGLSVVLGLLDTATITGAETDGGMAIRLTLTFAD